MSCPLFSTRSVAPPLPRAANAKPLFPRCGCDFGIVGDADPGIAQAFEFGPQAFVAGLFGVRIARRGLFPGRLTAWSHGKVPSALLMRGRAAGSRGDARFRGRRL